MKVAVLVVACLVAGVFSAPSALVDPALRRTLKANGSANIFISFKEGTSKVLASLEKAKFASREARLNGVAAALQAHAQKTQRDVLAHLNKIQSAGVVSFWINNKIFVPKADAKLIESLAANFPEILEITEEEIIQLDPILDAKHFEAKENRPMNEWGVLKIQAPDAWSLDGGNSGEGIVVANIDTGVRYTHETLRDNYRGDYGWLDPYDSSVTPIDRNGHGTVIWIFTVRLIILNMPDFLNYLDFPHSTPWEQLLDITESELPLERPGSPAEGATPHHAAHSPFSHAVNSCNAPRCTTVATQTVARLHISSPTRGEVVEESPCTAASLKPGMPLTSSRSFLTETLGHFAIVPTHLPIMLRPSASDPPRSLTL